MGLSSITRFFVLQSNDERIGKYIMI